MQHSFFRVFYCLSVVAGRAQPSRRCNCQFSPEGSPTRRPQALIPVPPDAPTESHPKLACPPSLPRKAQPPMARSHWLSLPSAFDPKRTLLKLTVNVGNELLQQDDSELVKLVSSVVEVFGMRCFFLKVIVSNHFGDLLSQAGGQKRACRL